MILRATFRNIRITLTIARIAKVIGVNSGLENGRHVLMWDFDNVPLKDVKKALRTIQKEFGLSDIHILRTKEPDNYIAYCFSSKPWFEAVRIVASTEKIDWQFLRFGVYRGHFTLRVTPKGKRYIKLVTRLRSKVKPDCKPDDLKSWVRYETLSWR